MKVLRTIKHDQAPVATQHGAGFNVAHDRGQQRYHSQCSSMSDPMISPPPMPQTVIFCPFVRPRARDPQRVALQCYRREPDGGFVRVYTGKGPYASVELAAFLLVVLDGAVARLRVARDSQGQDWVPTAGEAQKAEREARERAEREVAELRARLAQLEGQLESK